MPHCGQSEGGVRNVGAPYRHIGPTTPPAPTRDIARDELWSSWVGPRPSAAEVGGASRSLPVKRTIFQRQLVTSGSRATLYVCIDTDASPRGERNCADTVGTVPQFPGLAISSAKIKMHFFRTKYTDAILSNSTRKLLRWFEISKMLIAV